MPRLTTLCGQKLDSLVGYSTVPSLWYPLLMRACEYIIIIIIKSERHRYSLETSRPERLVKAFAASFYSAAMECRRGPAMRILSVRLSVRQTCEL